MDAARRDIGENPVFIARETLRKLATLRIPPTPDNYRRVYDEIAALSENILLFARDCHEEMVLEARTVR